MFICTMPIYKKNKEGFNSCPNKVFFLAKTNPWARLVIEFDEFQYNIIKKKHGYKRVNEEYQRVWMKTVMMKWEQQSDEEEMMRRVVV